MPHQFDGVVEKDHGRLEVGRFIAATLDNYRAQLLGLVEDLCDCPAQYSGLQINLDHYNSIARRLIFPEAR